MFLWIVSSASQNLLFVPFAVDFCTSVSLCFLFWGTYCHIFSSHMPHTWISLEDYNPFSSGMLYSSLYKEIQVYLQFMVVASYVYFVHEVGNGCNKARLVFFDSDLQNTQKCKQMLVCGKGKTPKQKTTKTQT